MKNEKQEIYKKIDKLLEKVGNTTNIQNNIHVNNYGNEDLTHISKSMMDDLITIPYRMIPKMIAAVHFNDEKPQNKNIFIPNKKDKFVKIFKNNKWIYQDREKAINKLVDDKYNVNYITKLGCEFKCFSIDFLQVNTFNKIKNVLKRDILSSFNNTFSSSFTYISNSI